MLNSNADFTIFQLFMAKGYLLLFLVHLLFYFLFFLGAALYEQVGLTLPYRQLTKNLPVICG
jgi:hypothetical protein